MRGELTLQTTFIGDPGKIKASEEETRAFYLALLIMRCDSDSGKKLIKSMVLRTADRQGMC